MTTQLDPDHATNPYLQGNYAPVQVERDEHDLAVTGQIPGALSGQLLRTGPNPAGPVGVNHHWFLGDGMVHGVRIDGGRALTYRNRWVRTPSLEAVRPDLPATGPHPAGSPQGKGAVHVIEHGNRILALGEVGLPYELTADLDTVGPCTFDGALTTSMTAHPKRDPQTGDLHFFGYDFGPVHLRYHRADPSGQLVQTEIIETPGVTMMHDFNITATRIVFMDLPVVFSMDRLAAGSMPFAWDAGHGARLGVMPIGGSGADVRWYEIEPCYVFHPLNAYDDGDRIVLDVIRYQSMFDTSTVGPEGNASQLWRWVIDPSTGSVSETQLEDRSAEFPRVPDTVVGRRHRFGYGALRNDDSVSRNFDTEGLVKFDLDRNSHQIHAAGAGRVPGEGVFVADPAGSAEDDGWVLSVVYDAATDRSDVIIVDARDFTSEPVATIHLPTRVPFGFHGSWVPQR